MKGNNPGNIRRVKGQTWQGETTPSPWAPGFATFISLQYGFRALALLLKNYISQGYDTITEIVNRWAPPSENDTANYIKFMVDYTGIPANAPLAPSDDNLFKLGRAIAEIEHSGTITATDLQALQAGIALLPGATGRPTEAQTAGGGIYGIVLGLLALLALAGNKIK